jgi:hypothetical protein
MLGLAPVSSAYAEQKIGIAVTIRNDVTGKLTSKTVVINDGEDVFGKEIIKTGTDSSAKIVLKDNTNLAVGPNASVTLDNFVYAGDSDYKKATFNLVKGGFRFVTGNSDKRAYEIKTPQSVLAVRGTTVDILSQGDRTIYAVQEGQGFICNPSKKCITLNAGETAVITAATVAALPVNSTAGWNFNGTCASNPSLCDVTQMSEATSNPATQTASLDPALTSGINPLYVAGALGIAGGIAAGVVVATKPNTPTTTIPILSTPCASAGC